MEAELSTMLGMLSKSPPLMPVRLEALKSPSVSLNFSVVKLML